jgi:hypothetical protein
MSSLTPDQIPCSQQAISVLWPSFIMAIVASGLFFSAFNPRDLIPYNLDIEISPLAAYSIGFFLFWLLAMLSSLGTMYFTISNCRFLKKQGN